MTLLVAGCSSSKPGVFTHPKHGYSFLVGNDWLVRAESGPPEQADEVAFMRAIDAPGKVAAYNPDEILAGAEGVIDGNLLLVTVKAEPNPKKLEPMEFLAQDKSSEKARLEKTDFNGLSAVRRTDVEGMFIIFVTVGETFYAVRAIELPGKSTVTGNYLKSDPEAVKLLEEGLKGLKFPTSGS
ncbi:MAG: hypothetical protein AMXMBFR33_35900 [Candidatus Xenobia bacterium]|jgi:hypothetical protein